MIETDDGSVPPFPASVLEQVAGGRRRRRGRGRDRRPAGLDHRRRRRAARRQRRAEPRLLGQRPLQDRFDPLTYVEGGPPTGDDEVVIDKASAEDEGFEVGDTVEIAGRAGSRRVHPRRDRDPGRRRLVRRRDDRRAHPARGPADDRQGGRVRPDLGRRRRGRHARAAGREARGGAARRVEVETGAENVESQRDDIGEFTGFIKTALLIFAGVALFVAAFLIFNTFSITVAQRTREFAMLRTLGANRRQILASGRARGVRDRPRGRRRRRRCRGSASRR